MLLRQVGETYGVGMSLESCSEVPATASRGERTLQPFMRNEGVGVKN